MIQPPRPLTYRQERILEFVTDYWRDMHRAPTMREIGEAVHISSLSVVNYNLNVLERSGLLHRDRDTARSITIPGVMCPTCGGTGQVRSA